MNLKFRIRMTTAITGMILGLAMAPARADLVGSMVLDITGGCFSYGANGATGCGNTNASNKEYAQGSFTFSNSITGMPASAAGYSYETSVTLSATNPITGTPFSDSQPGSFVSLNNLLTDPMFGSAWALVLGTISTGSFSAGGVTAAILSGYTPDGTIPDSANGTFAAWSTSDQQLLSQFLLGRALPFNAVDFTWKVTFDAYSADSTVSEPAMIALIGLGILGMGAAQRRKTHTRLAV